MGTTVSTSKGTLKGIVDDGLLVFRGIPFAQPPVGALRFRPPQPIEPWAGERDATAFGPVAMQLPNEALEAFFGRPRERPPMSEDCLYLNVWTPATDGAKRRVMLWIHGGGFTIGAGSEPFYDGKALASRDVVVVTINYRLGAFGFLCHDGFAESADGFRANFGMLDQVAALKWVQEEIEAFGGDPDNVTIFGESAGAMSVGTLLASPLAKGLFAKAILQSGAAHTIHTLDRARDTLNLMAEMVGVKELSVDLLRKLPAQEILEAQKKLDLAARSQMADGTALGLRFQPVVDGRFLPKPAIQAIRDGHAADIPVLIGTNRDEWKLFGAAFPPLREKMTEERAARNIERLSAAAGKQGRGQAIFEAYRAARSSRADGVDPYDVFVAAMSDWMFRIPADRLAEAQVAHNPNVFSYRFDWCSPLGNGLLDACHALELPFVFGVQGLAPKLLGGGPDADALARRMGDAWTAFARGGDPSTSELPWPAFDAKRRQTMVMDREWRIEEMPQEAERRCWDGIIP